MMSSEEREMLQESIRESSQMPTFFVVTNQQRIDGAGAIFYPEVMDNLGELLGQDYFILPSSIHEMLVLPDNGEVSADELRMMVTEVNATQVAPAERLTNDVYHFDTKDHIFEKSDRFTERQKEKETQAAKTEKTIEIDFQEKYNLTVPCIENSASEKYSVYLAIISGELLAALYDEYRDRLLEKNVRSFLQVKGAVNKGIRDTLRDEPEMFLAYNNGISVTAEGVEIVRDENGKPSIKKIRDMQIVNGGQTTASIFNAKRDKKIDADLSKVFVQMKISVISSPENMDEIVPRISAFANTQNKVQIADFSANDPYHRRIEELSRTVWAPAQGGLLPQNWFYERARGQYADMLTRETTTLRRKKFKETHMMSSVYSVTPVAPVKEKIADCYLCGTKLTQLLMLSTVDYEGKMQSLGAGQAAGIPAMVYASDLYAVNTALEDNPLPQSVLIDVSNMNNIAGQLDELDDLIRRNIPIICLTDTMNSFELDLLKQREFNIWRWDATSIRLNVYQKNARAISFYQREGFIIQCEGLDEATGEKEYTMLWKQK